MTLNDLKPFGDRLIVRPDAKAQTTEGGLIIPDVVTADNPNYFTMTGVVLKLGDGIREDVYRCSNKQCGYESRRTVGERCAICGATQTLIVAEDVRPFDVVAGDRVLFNRFAGKQVEVEESVLVVPMHPPTDEEAARYYKPGEITLSVSGESWNEVRREKVLIIREVEVLGILDDDARVLPGYEAPAWAKITSNKGDRRPGSKPA